MGFLRRLLGGDRHHDPSTDDSADRDSGDSASDESGEAAAPAELDDAERTRELELARFDQDRVDDLVRRQQRYADRSWTPPAQGGDRRSDDGDKTTG